MDYFVLWLKKHEKEGFNLSYFQPQLDSAACLCSKKQWEFSAKDIRAHTPEETMLGNYILKDWQFVRQTEPRQKESLFQGWKLSF